MKLFEILYILIVFFFHILLITFFRRITVLNKNKKNVLIQCIFKVLAAVIYILTIGNNTRTYRVLPKHFSVTYTLVTYFACMQIPHIELWRNVFQLNQQFHTLTQEMCVHYSQRISLAKQQNTCRKKWICIRMFIVVIMHQISAF